MLTEPVGKWVGLPFPGVQATFATGRSESSVSMIGDRRSATSRQFGTMSRMLDGSLSMLLDAVKQAGPDVSLA
jgi:hypothetical protein